MTLRRKSVWGELIHRKESIGRVWVSGRGRDNERDSPSVLNTPCALVTFMEARPLIISLSPQTRCVLLAEVMAVSLPEGEIRSYS